MTPAEAFGLTPEEQARLDAMPLSAGEDGWRRFASAVHEQIVTAYAAGEMPLDRALAVMGGCLLGCSVKDRITLLALTARRALLNPPTKRTGKRPPNPPWVRSSAAALVQMFRDDRPDAPIAPNEANNWTTPILAETIQCLVALGLCEAIGPRTLYAWYTEALKNGVIPATKRNTPLNSTSTA